jgi:hypothetical protein
MDIPTGLLLSASIGTSDPIGTESFNQPLAGFPIFGNDYVALSSGRADNAPLPNGSGSLSTELSGLNTNAGEDLVESHRDFDRLKADRIKRHAPIRGQAAALAQQWQGKGVGA